MGRGVVVAGEVVSGHSVVDDIVDLHRIPSDGLGSRRWAPLCPSLGNTPCRESKPLSLGYLDSRSSCYVYELMIDICNGKDNNILNFF